MKRGETFTWPNWCSAHKLEYPYGGKCPACAGRDAAREAIDRIKRAARPKPSEGTEP